MGAGGSVAIGEKDWEERAAERRRVVKMIETVLYRERKEEDAEELYLDSLKQVIRNVRSLIRDYVDPPIRRKSFPSSVSSESSEKSSSKMKLSLDKKAEPLSKPAMSLGLRLDLNAEAKPRAQAHPMSCPPMYLLKQRKKWPATPMRLVLERNVGEHPATSDEIKAPPIETRKENLNFIGLTIPSWEQNDGDVTLRDRTFGRERSAKRKAHEEKRIARSVLLSVGKKWEIYADPHRNGKKFYRNVETGLMQDFPPSELAESRVSLKGLDGHLAPRGVSDTSEPLPETPLPLTSSESDASSSDSSAEESDCRDDDGV